MFIVRLIQFSFVMFLFLVFVVCLFCVVGEEMEEFVEVLFFGIYYFVNFGQDMVNFEVDDVFLKICQEEIVVLVCLFVEWKLIKIVVENVVSLLYFCFESFVNVCLMFEEVCNEMVQIGFCFVDMLGYSLVYGYDEQFIEDELDYFFIG